VYKLCAGVGPIGLDISLAGVVGWLARRTRSNALPSSRGGRWRDSGIAVMKKVMRMSGKDWKTLVITIVGTVIAGLILANLGRGRD